MAAPTVTARSGSGNVPAGIKLGNGFSSVFRFALDPDFSLWAVSTKPPGIDGGDPVNVTTMENELWRTKDAGALLDLTEGTIKAGYDPNVYNQGIAMINLPQSITQHFPDGSTLAFYGFLKSLAPNDLAENQMPLLDAVIVPTNFDPVNKVEAGPVLTSVAGT